MEDDKKINSTAMDEPLQVNDSSALNLLNSPSAKRAKRGMKRTVQTVDSLPPTPYGPELTLGSRQMSAAVRKDESFIL